MTAVQTVKYDVIEGVGVITIDNPPVNAFGEGMREAVMDAVARANADAAITAIVLIGAGRNFSTGSDVRRFGSARAVSTRTSAAVIEASDKPIIAALHGHVLGGGLEHAIACHYRVAAPSAKLGLPEVTLGLVPAGGGTQRLPRLIGPEAALDLIVSGRRITAAQARQLGLIDEIVEEGDLRDAAIRFAKRMQHVRPLRRARDIDARLASARSDPSLLATLRKSVASKARRLNAPLRAFDCVEAAVLRPFDEGIRFEQTVFTELESSDQAKGLRYAFFAEREAAKIPGAPADAKPAAIKTAAVIGAGTMGSGITICFADAGIPVRVVEISAEALDRGLQRIGDTYATRVKRGSLTQPQMDERLARITGVLRYEEIADCDAVIESVFERIDLKKDVFERLDAVMKPGALLLTNSSAIDINTMANMTRRPQDVAGAHFFAPANVMKLFEVVRGDASSMDTILGASKLGRDLGKMAVVSGTCDGFAANRSRAPLVSEAMILLEEGALPEQVDKVMVDFGYPMGPFAVSDLSGLDVSYDTRARRAAANPDFRKLPVPDRMVELGRKGQKNGKGWYRYEAGDRTPRPDEEVRRIIATVAAELGTPQRSFTDGEILRRLLLASVNEACRIVDEGRAYRASDIDVMWINGFGFPRYRGGLMYWADGIGAAAILAQLTEWHGRYGKRWQPSALLERVATQGGLLRDAKAVL